VLSRLLCSAGRWSGSILAASLLLLPVMVPATAADGASGAARVPLAPPAAGERRELSCPQLGNFPYDPLVGGNIPQDVLALDGMQVRMRGTVTPWDLNADNSSVLRFALTDGQSCCFGGPPRLQHVVVVSYARGLDLALADGWVCVDGRLSVREIRSAGLTQSLFSIEASAVTVSARPAAARLGAQARPAP